MTDLLTRLAALTAKDENGLLPCPFCGDKGQPLIWRKGNEHTKERGCDVGCAECHFTKRIRVIRYSIEWAEERAIAEWNTRPREQALIALVREAAGEIERLRAALSFYADTDSDGYDIQVTNYGLSTEEGDIIKDGGAKAREALKPQVAS